jgi:hypothetical protein
MTQLLSAKDPAEIIPITFDFSSVVTTITSVSSVSVSIKTGIDATVATMIECTAQIVGTTVVQLIKAGLSDVTYTVRAEILSGTQKYVLAATLPVTTAQ